MLSGVFLVNRKAEIVISRLYRDDVVAAAATAFRANVIAAKNTGNVPPIQHVDGHYFSFIRHKDLFIVAVTRSNANVALGFATLFALRDVFAGYFGESFDESKIRGNFTLVYELLDEVIDFGYPQTTSTDVLKLYINLGSVKAPVSAGEQRRITSTITGARDWRREGIVHKKNQVFLDIVENVNLLISSQGTVLRNDVTGAVLMKSQLSGMPECKLALNDKLQLSADGRDAGRGVELDDVSFHRCVQLGKFDTERTITFVPPDGDFELMKYRVTHAGGEGTASGINLPFRVLPVIEESALRVTVNIKVMSNFSKLLNANNVVIKIPAPTNTARAHITTATGRAKYEAESRALVWRIRKFPGSAEASLQAQLELMPSRTRKPWSRPPINVEFQVPMFTASGLHVRTLKVFEKSNYPTTKWVRYVTRAAGSTYQIKF